MLGATVADASSYARTSPRPDARGSTRFLGNPPVALLVGTLVATDVFGTRRGLDGARLLAIAERSLFPIASVLLIVGAGGGFGRVLEQAGIGRRDHAAVSSLSLSPLLFGWLVAALLRVAVGSATVAITTAAASCADPADGAGTNRELLVVALGAGSLIASHVNDGGLLARQGIPRPRRRRRR